MLNNILKMDKFYNRELYFNKLLKVNQPKRTITASLKRIKCDRSVVWHLCDKCRFHDPVIPGLNHGFPSLLPRDSSKLLNSPVLLCLLL